MRRSAHVISTTLGVISLLLAWRLPDQPKSLMAIPGVLYVLMGPLHAWNGYSRHRAHDKLRNSLAVSPSE